MKLFKSLLILISIFCVSNFDLYAKGRSYSSGGSSFKSSSSSRPSYSAPKSTPRPSYSAPKSTPRPSYSAPRPSYSAPRPSYSAPKSSPSYSSGSSKPPSSSSTKPSSSSFNSGLSHSAHKQQSQNKFVASSPKPSYKTPGPSGVQRPIDPNSASVKNVRNISHERYVTYEHRSSGFYGGFYSSPHYYHDSFSPFLMGWMMSDALNSHQRATWIYNHRSEIDDARYRDLLAKDAKLQAELDLLKQQGVVADPSYVPPQMAQNPDLMYSKDFVEAAYNPSEQVDAKVYSLFGILGIVACLALFVFFVYLILIKDF